MKLPMVSDFLEDLKDGYYVFSDFTEDQTDTTFIDTLTDTGTAVVGDAAGGVIVLTPSDCSVADNDQVLLESANENFLFAADKPLVFESRVQFTQANTNAANIFAGLVDGVAAELLVDNGAGPKTTASGVAFFCKDGSLNWHVWSSLSTTQTSVELTAANSLDGAAKPGASSGYQRLRIEVLPKSATLQDVLYYIDDVLVYKITDMVFTSATEMAVAFSAKNGSAHVQPLNVDYAFAWQKR